MQHDILDRMGRAEILALAVGGADEVFLVLRKVGSAALIHFAAALCAIQKPGEHTHFTHLGRTATRLANVLNNQEHAFFDDRGWVFSKITQFSGSFQIFFLLL